MEEWDTTEPLKNGDKLPDHPNSTNASRIIEYGEVIDDGDGTILQGGLHRNEIEMLMHGEQGALKHLYRFAIRDRKIYHTRQLVTINVKTTDIPLVL